MSEEPAKIVAFLSARKQKRAKELWDEFMPLEDLGAIDGDLRRLLAEFEEIDRARKQEEAER